MTASAPISAVYDTLTAIQKPPLEAEYSMARNNCSNYDRLMSPRLFIAVLLLIAPPFLASATGEVVREQRNITIDGSKEIWRLAWRGTPDDSNSCGPADSEEALTCPCKGFAYAQVGDLVLERQRPGALPERMALSPLFAETDAQWNDKSPTAMLARWPARLKDVDRRPNSTAIRGRPIVPAMRLRDYNHDGIAGEFLLQVNAGPCGHRALVAVGITRANPHLHALTTAEHPERPLTLSPEQWEALARNPHPGALIDVSCGDHGAEEETAVALSAVHGSIHATSITSTCPDTTSSNGEWHHDNQFRKRMLKREAI